MKKVLIGSAMLAGSIASGVTAAYHIDQFVGFLMLFPCIGLLAGAFGFLVPVPRGYKFKRSEPEIIVIDL